MSRLFRVVFPVLIACVVAQAEGQDELLTIGSKAPALDVEHWFPSEVGEEPVTEFESDQVYVVEFWATWCPPCIASMPHLAELQKEYADKDVTIISVSDEPLETINPFLAGQVRNYRGDAETTPTYTELTSAYRLTTDPDGSTETAYMRAAGQNGIPTAFLVGKTGKIEWIGHPMELDDVLAAVVDDVWDRDAFAEQFVLKQKMAKLQGDLMTALQQGGAEAAFGLLDQFAEENQGPGVEETVAQLRAAVTRQVFVMEIGQDEKKDLERLEAQLAAIDGEPRGTNQVAWMIYQISAQGRPVSKAVIGKAADAAEESLKAGVDVASLLDTISHLYYEMGDLDAAIDFEDRALKHPSANENPGLKGQIEKYLTELRSEKAAAAE